MAQNGGWGGPKKRDAAILSVPIEAGIKYAKSNMRKKCCILLVAASNRKKAAEQSKAARSESEKRSSQQEAGKINRGSSRGERETERERARLSLFLRLLHRPFCLSSVSRRLALLLREPFISIDTEKQY